MKDNYGDDASTSIPSAIPPLRPLLLLLGSVGPDEEIAIPITYFVTQDSPDIRGLIIASSTESPDEIMSVPLAHTLAVLPALVVQASAKPSRSHLGHHTVIVEVTNTAETPIRLDQIATVSHTWSSSDLDPCVLTFKFQTSRWGYADDADRLDVVLSPNQTYRSIVDVRASADATVDIRQTQLVNNLEKLLDNQPELFDLQHPGSSDVQMPSNDVAPYISSRSAFRAETLQRDFPTITPSMAASLFPLLDPLDLDISIAWSMPDKAEEPQSRQGNAFQHAIRVGPRFSIVEGLRAKVDAAIASGSKQTRTMYEETGRLRKLLLDSVLDGELSREHDPLLVRAYLENAKKGALTCDFTKGQVTCFSPHVESVSSVGGVTDNDADHKSYPSKSRSIIYPQSHLLDSSSPYPLVPHYRKNGNENESVIRPSHPHVMSANSIIEGRYPQARLWLSIRPSG